MKKKNRLLILVTSLFIVLGILGGCGMFTKPSLTKEQQDNVVRWIARGYNVDSVEFTNYEKDSKTGMYLLSFELNASSKYKTTISIQNHSDFDENEGRLGLNPISRFINLEKKIVYLKIKM